MGCWLTIIPKTERDRLDIELRDANAKLVPYHDKAVRAIEAKHHPLFEIAKALAEQYLFQLANWRDLLFEGLEQVRTPLTDEQVRTSVEEIRRFGARFCKSQRIEFDNISSWVKNPRPGEKERNIEGIQMSIEDAVERTIDDFRDWAGRHEASTNSAVVNLPAHVHHTDGTKAASPELRLDANARLAYWGAKRLTINSHADFTVLADLLAANGAIVLYVDLLRAIKPTAVVETVEELTEAPPEVKEAASHIRAAMRSVGCLFELMNIRFKGYRLRPPDE